jgi:hypothetical protein
LYLRSVDGAKAQSCWGIRRDFQGLKRATGVFNAEDREVLKAVAAQATIAIEAARLIEGLKRQPDALFAETRQLWRAVEVRYFHRILLENSPLMRQSGSPLSGDRSRQSNDIFHKLSTPNGVSLKAAVTESEQRMLPKR